MRTKIFFIGLFIVGWSTPLMAQQDSVTSVQLDSLRLSVRTLTEENQSLRNKFESLSDTLALTSAQVRQNTNNIRTTANELGVKIDTATTQLSSQHSELQANVKNKVAWGIVLLIVVCLLGGIVYWLLHRKIKGNGNVIEQIKESQTALKEESVKLDTQLMELLDKQITVTNSTPEPTEADHTLILKVADEVITIEANLSRMDSSIKGCKQLKRAVEHIRNNMMSKGYELVDMLGKQYKEGMRVVANFVQDDTLPEGEQVITRIIKPQVNFNGVMIQTAQIEVSQNE